MRSVAISDDPVALEAAEDVLLAGGSALGAVVAGFFAAAGAHSGVLLSPVTLLAAGPGLGARAFDGRCRQPGLGTRRPRGFKEGEEIPGAARIAVPAAVTAVLVALSYDEQARVGRLVKAALRRARDSGAEARAALFERIRSVGAGAIQEATFVRPLLHSAGEAVGGLLTGSDLRAITNVDIAAKVVEGSSRRYVEAPWADDASAAGNEDLGIGLAVCAADVRGLFAGLCYRRVLHGIPVEELELEAPAVATPVLRGVTRVAPGEPIPAPAPVVIALDGNGNPAEIAVSPAAIRLDGRDMSGAKLRIRWDEAARRPEVVKG